MNKKTKIIELRSRNTKKRICREMSNMFHINMNSFLSIDNTLKLQKTIMSIIYEMDLKKSAIKIPKSIQSCHKYIKNNINLLSSKEDKNIIFFHHDSVLSGGIILNIKDVICCIDYLIENSELRDQEICFFLVDEYAEYGFCLWRGEYDATVYVWGLF